MIVVFIEDGTTFRFGVPRQGPVSERLGENDCRPRGTCHLLHKIGWGRQVGMLDWEGKIGLVAAGYAGEAAVAGRYVGEVIRDNGEGAADFAIFAVIVQRWIERRAAAMQASADRAEPAANDVQVDVVEPSVVAVKRLQMRKEGSVVD
jgi:hypothetical protein